MHCHEHCTTIDRCPWTQVSAQRPPCARAWRLVRARHAGDARAGPRARSRRASSQAGTGVARAGSTASTACCATASCGVREPRAVDKLVPGRRIERADQYHRGVRVFGADVARQFAGGQIVSIFGDALRRHRRRHRPRGQRRRGAAAGRERVPACDSGRPRRRARGPAARRPASSALTWRLRAAQPATTCANTSSTRTPAPSSSTTATCRRRARSARATGVLGDSKKISAIRVRRHLHPRRCAAAAVDPHLRHEGRPVPDAATSSTAS